MQGLRVSRRHGREADLSAVLRRLQGLPRERRQVGGLRLVGRRGGVDHRYVLRRFCLVSHAAPLGDHHRGGLPALWKKETEGDRGELRRRSGAPLKLGRPPRQQGGDPQGFGVQRHVLHQIHLHAAPHPQIPRRQDGHLPAHREGVARQRHRFERHGHRLVPLLQHPEVPHRRRVHHMDGVQGAGDAVAGLPDVGVGARERPVPRYADGRHRLLGAAVPAH
mmetsp:Transcript_68671/g.192514  ORF Transcript_68671/g.192514 Transcript_68671/m.192514 type:complete len:221 (+) Transcript_68671:446-1108(+)